MTSKIATTPTYQKVDPTKLCFFDLPLEVRDKVYIDYFSDAPDYIVHLVNLNLSTGFLKQSAKVSTKCHVHILPEYRREFSPLDGDSDLEEIASAPTKDLFNEILKPSLVWSALEATTKALFEEADRYSFHSQRFTILGYTHGYGMGPRPRLYHSNLTVLPPRLLLKIRRLVLDESMVGYSFNRDDEGWVRGFWPVVLTQMVRLRDLSLTSLDPGKLCRVLGVLTALQACFLGERPSISIELDLYAKVEDQSFWLINRSFKTDRLAARFLVPPLKTIKLCGWTDRRFCNSPRRIDFGDWDGSVVKLVDTVIEDDRDRMWERREKRFYEVEWASSADQ